MKCIKKKRYDCFYITKDNIDEFIKWFHQFEEFDEYKYINTDYDKDALIISNDEYDAFNLCDYYYFSYDSYYVRKGYVFEEYTVQEFNEIFEMV